MIELMFLAVVGAVLFTVFLAVAVFSLVVKAVFWILFFPLRLIFGLLLLPLLLIKAILGGLVLTALAVVGVVLAIVVAAVIAVPLLPLLALGFVIWLLVRGGNRPALAR